MGDAPRRSPGDWPWSAFVSELRLILEHEDGVQGALELDVPLVAATRDVRVLMDRPPYLGFTDALAAALEGWIGRLNDEQFETALLWHFGIAKGSSLDSARARRTRAIATANWGPDAYHK